LKRWGTLSASWTHRVTPNRY